MSNEPSESSTNFSMDSSSGSGNIHEPLLDLVNSLLNSTSNSNNFIINTPTLIVSTSNITPPEQDFNNNDVSTNEEPNQTIGITPQTVPLLHSIPDGNSLIDFLNFVETSLLLKSCSGGVMLLVDTIKVGVFIIKLFEFDVEFNNEFTKSNRGS